MVENSVIFLRESDFIGWAFQFGFAPDLGQDGFCSTWNISRFGLLPKMFHVERRKQYHDDLAHLPRLRSRGICLICNF